MANKLTRTWGTGKKISGGLKIFRQWKAYKEGDVFVGKFTKQYTDEKYNQECYVFEVLDCSFKVDGKSIIGKSLVLNHIGMLGKAMEEATIGDIVQVEYTGVGKIEKGKFKGKEAHTVDVSLLETGDGSEQPSETEEEDDDVL